MISVFPRTYHKLAVRLGEFPDGSVFFAQQPVAKNVIKGVCFARRGDQMHGIIHVDPQLLEPLPQLCAGAFPVFNPKKDEFVCRKCFRPFSDHKPSRPPAGTMYGGDAA